MLFSTAPPLSLHPLPLLIGNCLKDFPAWEPQGVPLSLNFPFLFQSLVLEVLTAAAAQSLQSCPTLCAPETAAHQAPLSLGFSRQEHWSGLPLPSPMHESEVAQRCPTPSDPMDCSLPGSSIHGSFQARVLEWGAIEVLTVLTVL